MATLVTTCPSCNGPLRIPDELVGQRVRCPSCQTIFHAAAPAAPSPSEPTTDTERPLWKNLQLELDNGDPASPDREPAPQLPARRPGLIGAVEVGSTGAPEDAPPKQKPSPEEPPKPRARPRERFEDDDDEDYRPSGRSRYRRELPRRDSEPHRGPMILVFGIISIASVILNMCYIGVLIGLPLGITAWVMGSNDLRKIKKGEMDEEGLGTTQAGWICGIVGTILHSLVLLLCGGFITFLLVSGANNTPPRAPFAPTPVPAIKQPIVVPPPPPVVPGNEN
jgi:predicted Zn finger-like uncharacterized protein